ncbi:MAG: PIN domain-containing protein [Deltaproteobacteria bacterium]|nr:MAG: PIN domain-containing protein [Deltaproteobacteria bacterium]
MIPYLILDTSVYIQHFRFGKTPITLYNHQFLIRNSAIVLAELYRGCRNQKEKNEIDELSAGFPIVTPTEKIWMESGQLLSHMLQKKKLSADYVKNLHFDVLIALTARSIGGTVMTYNKQDFEEILKIKDFKLITLEK